MLSRRAFHGLLGTGLLGALAPRLLRAAPATAGEHKFLFIFVSGGWDPTWVFAPLFGRSGIDMDPTATMATVGGIPIVDAGSRPSVRRYFETYGNRSAILNGMEVRAVAHERCRRLLFTGKSQDIADDWPAILAGESSGYALPCVVLSGPSYTTQYTSSVVRVGESGQLSGLLDGSSLGSAEPPHQVPSSGTDAKIQAFLNQRIDQFATEAGRGQPQRYAMELQSSMEQIALVRASTGLDLSVGVSGIAPVSERIRPALNCLERGEARCAVIEHAGQFDVGWDTHSNISMQGVHFELLFQDLLAIVGELERRRGVGGGSLLEETTVVVCSEMGRTPRINSNGGKDHWTYTSALLIGAGLRSGVVGGYDDSLLGQPMDLDSGELFGGGTLISSENLGATLLAMAELDPAMGTGAPPIRALLA